MVSIQERILASFEGRVPLSYTPSFRVEREAKGWRIYDRAEAIGFFGDCGWLFFDIWKFSPHDPAIFANERMAGKVVDIHTLHNTVMNIPVGAASDLVQGVADPVGHLRPEWVKGQGAELELMLSGVYGQGQRAQFRFRAIYDSAWARYRYFFDADVWKLSPSGMEPWNMMMAGALHSRSEKRRWTHSIWEGADGKLRRLVHSNALFDCTDYASADWRSKNGPDRGAWIAYGVDSVFNPAVLVHRSSVPVRFATCSQLFDEHILWQQAGLEHLDEGYFHFELATELVSLDAALAAELLERASDPPRPRQWRYRRIALPFRMDEVNSFESAVDPWRPEECPILTVDEEAGRPIRWVSGMAHSGSRSLQFEGRNPTGWTVLTPGGAVCNIDPGARYRFSAWVRTKDVERFARLELQSVEYSYSNVIDGAYSRMLGATNDWTLLSVELDSGDEAYLVPRMALYGTGLAWFDDVKLERIG
ncbi:MAG: hypothetical protein HYU36_16480 [Planctomycetes bacterium]|nr:hypothetical protein [Planctomycetota bacterium]